jgi:apolipoprotein N-acyltransferase
MLDGAPMAKPASNAVPWKFAIPALIFSGAIQTLLSPPVNLWLLHPIAFAPAIYALRHREGGRGLLAGWIMGAAANAAIFPWVVHTVQTFSNLPTWAALLCLLGFALVWGFYGAVFGWGFGVVVRRAGTWWPVAIAAWFTACEYLNPQLFPYYQGVSWYQVPEVFLVTGLTGVPGMTFGLLLCSAVLVAAIVARREPSPEASLAFKRSAAVLAFCVVVALSYSQVRLQKIAAAEVDAPTTRFALVQTNLDVFRARAMRQRSQFATVNRYIDQSIKALEADPDIDVFVFPEGGLRGAATGPLNLRARQFVKDFDVEVWTGAGTRTTWPDGTPGYQNSAVRIHGDGVVSDDYDKNILLPFGEFMPLAGVFPILRRIKGVGNFIPGDGLEHFETPHGTFVFLICYEAIRHRYVREGVRRGSDVLVNITYDAWFGDTANPSQHMMLSAIQSAVFGVPLIRSATTGISAFVDARGMIVEESEVFTRATLVRDVKRVRVPTVYGAVGDWFAWMCIVGSGVLLVGGIGGGPIWRRRTWLAWCGVLVGLLGAPLAWLPNQYLPLGDWLAWLFALGCVVVVAVRKARG